MTSMTTQRRSPETGFSLVELMVAMVITLMITGAIFSLLSSGQSAFKVQPERTDRQQNIRTAMDLIIRDASSAGVGMPPFIQTFTPALDGTGPVSPFGGNTDQLEILANTAGFSNEEVCLGGSGDEVILKKAAIDFGIGTDVMLLFQDGSWTVRSATGFGTDTGTAPCTGSGHVSMTVDSNFCAPSATGLGTAGSTNVRPGTCGGASPCCDLDTATGVGFGQVIRYRVNVDAEGIPNLERSINGGTFQVVARAIEDLQVQYVDQAGTVTDSAPAVDPTAVDYTTLITEVRVTLSARAVSTRIQGATYASGTTGAALRGRLTAQITPREALSTLTTETGTPKWN
jgi:type II secretory pathway pseudopilin PulG